MAEIKTADEQAALNSILDSQAKAEYWIGLTETSVTGKSVWQHSNSTVGPWTNWDNALPTTTGQPDNCGDSARCAEIRRPHSIRFKGFILNKKGGGFHTVLWA